MLVPKLLNSQEKNVPLVSEVSHALRAVLRPFVIFFDSSKGPGRQNVCQAEPETNTPLTTQAVPLLEQRSTAVSYVTCVRSAKT
jgi:hypothetical protein